VSAPEIAVLSYHGWEIDPERLAADVRALRTRGWRDVSLAQLQALSGASGRFFHVTIDDGAEGDRDCVLALSGLSCSVTLFVSLEAMTESARAVHRELVTHGNVAVGDHSLQHNRTFHYRLVIGFHSDMAPLVSSPERLGLEAGDPICVYGGELSRPEFRPDSRAVALCREAARGASAAPGSATWREAIANRLIESGLGYRRFGRLCIAGVYESDEAFEQRLATYLARGRDHLSEFTGSAPLAFAYPWWQPSRAGDECLRRLGYQMTFSGQGLCRLRSTFNIPRLFVNNETPRPLDPLAQGGSPSLLATRMREMARRAAFA
jgi:hypothetical protein